MIEAHVVAARGGAGNQLFAWSYGAALARTGATVRYSFVQQYERRPEIMGSLIDIKHCISFTEPMWRFSLNRWRGSWVHRFNVDGDHSRSRARPLTFHWGYWQDWRLAAGLDADERRAALDALAGNSKPSSRGYGAVHIRRGDYVTNNAASRILGAQKVGYYVQATKLLLDRGTDQIVFVTDDPQWVEEYVLPLMPNGYDYSVASTDLRQDFRTLADAEAVVISNSTFSWWAAFLGGADRFVVRPKHWFADGAADRLSYPGWTVIDNYFETSGR